MTDDWVTAPADHGAQDDWVKAPAAVNGPFTQRTVDGRLITRTPTPEESKPMDWGAAGNAAAAGMVDKATFNQGNKLDAELQSLTGIGGTKGDYEGNLAKIEAEEAKIKAANPGAYEAGGAVGMYANPVVRGAQGVANEVLPTTGTGVASVLSKYANRVGVGAGAGAGYGAAEAPPGERAQAALRGAIGGGLTAGLMQVGGDLLAPFLSHLNAEPVPSEEEFKQAAQRAYKAVDDSGLTISQDSFKSFVGSLPGDLRGFHPKVTPGAANIIDALKDEADQGPVTLSTLDKLRSIAGEASVSTDRNEARLAGSIANKIDDFVDNLKPGDLAAEGADPYQMKAAQGTVDKLNEARDAWRTYSKMKAISDIVDTGENLNDPNWVKGRFRAIVKKPSLFNRYTPDEQEAISDIAETSTAEKLLKLIPLRGLQMSSTYADPLLQDMKIRKLQDLIAGGGVRAPAAAALGAAEATPYLSGAAGSEAAQILSPHPEANDRR